MIYDGVIPDLQRRILATLWENGGEWTLEEWTATRSTSYRLGYYHPATRPRSVFIEFDVNNVEHLFAHYLDICFKKVRLKLNNQVTEK